MANPKSKLPAAASSSAPKQAAGATTQRASTSKPTNASQSDLPVTQPSLDKVAEKRIKKEKIVRASFNMPESQIVALSELKARCLRLGITAKKGEVLAAGIQLLRNLPETSFAESILPYLSLEQKVPNGKMRRKMQ